jgi:hypothetical protein
MLFRWSLSKWKCSFGCPRRLAGVVNERATMISLVMIFGLLAVGAVLVAYGTLAQNRWGINLGAVLCPRCDTPLPKARKPQSLRQAMWGGGTCPACGVEVDKWG